jgi:hypothetical protein
MEITNIPKSFWHAVSISIISLTFGFLFIAYRSTSISIEIANTKIALTQAAVNVERASSALQDQVAAVQKEQLQQQASRGAERGIDAELITDCASLDPPEKLDCERIKAFEKIAVEIDKAARQAQEASQRVQSIHLTPVNGK